MSDLISRQAAIDRLREFANDDMTSTEKAIGADYCVDLIRTMPSAQPEIVRCKDCKYYGYNECFHVRGLTVAFDNTFCSCAERRTDE